MNTRITLAFFILLTIASFYIFELDQYLNLTYLKSNQTQLHQFYIENKGKTLILYFLIYVLTTTLSIPGATILTLAAASIFGFWNSLILISFASTLGATLSFLSSRYLFRNIIQQKFRERFYRINQGIKKEGAFYLLTMRLMPIFPFFMINLLMGLTPIKISTYFFTSQIGMLPGTILYINAGIQLSEIESTKDLLSLDIIFSLILLGFFPLLVRQILSWYRRKKN